VLEPVDHAIGHARVGRSSLPDDEMFVTDGRGKARMLLTYETTSGALSGPVFALPGKGTLEMNSLCVGLAVDGRGHFL
jgi:hypothetical protein